MTVITRLCSASECQKPAAPKSRYCGGHRISDWRNGDPHQRAVTIQQVAPFVCHTAEAITSRPDAGQLWRVLEERWSTYYESAQSVAFRGIVSDPEMVGSITTRKARPFEVEAAKAIHKTVVFGRSVPKPREIITNVLALILMREVEPERFVTDRAFLFQVARRFLCLNKANATLTGAGNGSTEYKPLKAKAMEHLGEYLLKALGAAGQSLVAAIKEDIAIREAGIEAYEEAVASLGPKMIPLDDLFPVKRRGPVFDPVTGMRNSTLKWFEKHGKK